MGPAPTTTPTPTAGPSATPTPTLTVVLPPTNLRVSSIVNNLLTLRWDPPSSGLAPTHYVVEAGLSPGEVIAVIATPGVDPILTATAPAGAYYVRVYAQSGGGRSLVSNEIRVFVQVPASPSAPANALAAVNGSGIALSWRNTWAGGVPTSVVLDVTGSIVTSVSVPVTETIGFATVPPGTYTVAARAVNAAGSSAPSNSVTFVVPGPCSGPPQPPANFLAYRAGTTLFALWDPPANGPALTSYVLSVSGAFTASFPTTLRSLNGAVGPGVYTLSVTAVNACGSSPATASQTIVVP